MTEFRRLTKRYSSAVSVDQLSFGFRRAKSRAFPGPNGSGKSTTMRLIPAWILRMPGTPPSADRPAGPSLAVARGRV